MRSRVETLLAGKRQRDCPRMYAKTAIILVAFAGLYTLLVFFASTWWQAVPLAILLGLVAAEIGFNIQHDGSHKAYSDRAWINKAAAMTLDVVGGSSYIWRWKHVVFHHMYVNVEGHDADIDIAPFGRLSPHQRRRKFYRMQHWYLWPLYGVIAIKWHFFDDFRDLVVGRIGVNPFPRPQKWELVLFFAGKAVFFTLAFVIP
ncbi:MAG: fatty acid desaturase family protein, partial [Gammaproteobacteria bacterium]